MALHDDPQALIETLVAQHAQVLGELHGDMVARLSEVPGRFVDQGDNPRPFAISSVLLETVLMSRQRRQTKKSTLKAQPGNGIGIVLRDGKGTSIRVRRYPDDPDGGRLKPVTYQPGATQMSFDELGKPLVGGGATPAPGRYEIYVLWWPGSLALGGVVLAAGVLTETDEIIYATTPLPPPIMEVRLGAAPVAVATQAAQSASRAQNKRRRDDDFGDIAVPADDATPDLSS